LSSTGNPDALENDPSTEILRLDAVTGGSPELVSRESVPPDTGSLRPARESRLNRLGAVQLHTERLRTAHTTPGTVAAEEHRPGRRSAARRTPARTGGDVLATAAGGAGFRGRRAGGTRGRIVNIVVLAFAAALVGTMAIPAYAFNPGNAAASQFGTSTIGTLSKAGAQTVKVGTVDASSVSRDPLSATSVAELAAQKAAALAAQQAAAARAQVAANFANYQAAYSGPSVTDFLANPPYPSFSLPQVFQVAKQYIGVPYVFGGATPAGFDCSGFVMFVYAQFGIALPHSVSGIAAHGTRISIADAVPGDLIVMPGHIGFYAGNGEILDAPDSGKSISIRPIWTTDYYVVRLGI
jgi:cell wall-associated NlpC family hydrolase